MKSEMQEVKNIVIKFYQCEKNYTFENAKRFLVARFMKTNNIQFLAKLTDLINGETIIVLGGI